MRCESNAYLVLEGLGSRNMLLGRPQSFQHIDSLQLHVTIHSDVAAQLLTNSKHDSWTSE